MINQLKELFLVLTPEERRKILVLQLLVILTAIFELIGVASIGPFMALISDPEIIYGNNILARIYLNSGINNYDSFIFYAGVTVFFLLAISSIVSMYTVWVLSFFGERLGISIGNRLFEFYIHRPWLFHTSENSATLTRNMMAEAGRVKDGIITPFMQSNAKVFLVVFFSIALLIYDPLIALTALITFAFSYFIIYKIAQTRLSINSENTSLALNKRFKLISEGFGGIKDVLFLRSQDIYIKRMSKEGDVIAQSRGSVVAISQTPRYLMELIIFGGAVIFILYLVEAYEGQQSSILPVIAVYTLAGFKLLPAFQNIYANTSTMQGNMSAFESIKKDLKETLRFTTNKELENGKNNQVLSINESITLSNIEFTYPEKDSPALQGLNIKIPKNKIIGLVGPSGSGKSTTIDILLGLINPTKGEILIDGNTLPKNNIGELQDKIGFVPQSIFLSDASILENVAFGLDKNKIDVNQVKKAIELSHLSDVVAELPEGLNTRVGENGVQLSGGQRQRIGIARALYRDCEILVLDEATSSLDNISEKMVMDSIHKYLNLKTIVIVAHRLTTVEKCDVLYLISKGKVVDSGTYKYLSESNEDFFKMANITK